MSIVRLALLSSLVLAGSAVGANAGILIQVDQSTQTMSVDVDGQHLYDWRVSTGRPSHATPNGTFTPNRMDADHYSKEYDNAPMPHAIFFDLDGDAIHGTPEPVGQPAASHGCVRLSPRNAAILFRLVAKEGMANTEVDIGGDVEVALSNSGASRRTVVAGAPSPGYGDLDPAGEYSSGNGEGQPYQFVPPGQYVPYRNYSDRNYPSYNQPW